MDEYHFFADLLSTWRSMNDDTKHLIIICGFATFFASLNACLIVPSMVRNSHEIRMYKIQNPELFPPEPSLLYKWLRRRLSL
jgi:hypothetical protein